MEMRIDPDGKRLRFAHRVVSTERMREAVRFTYDHSGAFKKIIRCSMCNRVQMHCAWMEADAACADGQIQADQLVIYSVCPGCKAAVRRPRQARQARLAGARQVNHSRRQAGRRSRRRGPA